MDIKHILTSAASAAFIAAVFCGCSAEDDAAKYLKDNNISGVIVESVEYDDYIEFECNDDLGDGDDSTNIEYDLSYNLDEKSYFCDYDAKYAGYIAEVLQPTMAALAEKYGVDIYLSANVIRIGEGDVENYSEMKEEIFQAMRDADFRNRLKGRRYEWQNNGGWGSSSKFDFE